MTEGTFVIRGGTVVTDQAVSRLDVRIEGETITSVGEFPDTDGTTVVDAVGLLVLPGAVDPHIHFNERNKGQIGVHDFLTGGRAAAFGGTTTVIDFGDQIHGEPLLSVLDKKKAEAEGKAVVDWNLHPIVNHVTPEVLEEIPTIVEAGLPTIKCFMTFRSLTGESAVNMYSGKPGRIISDEDFCELTARLGAAGGMLMVHAEDSTIIDKLAEKKFAGGHTRAIDHAQSRPPESEGNAVRNCCCRKAGWTSCLCGNMSAFSDLH